MDKLRMETPDLTQCNIEKLATLFPSCITEGRDENGNLKKMVNFELLQQMLSDVILEGDEAYEFTWVGKKAAIVEANRPIRKTLRPCPEESVNWDNTENLYIEGDNLEVLKLLQESYLGKVKMIYIDPPYNTGNDFIYRDHFVINEEEYNEETGQTDENKNKIFKNTDTNGRFHSNWCSMIYSRLILARNMLDEDGVIFISIDNHELDTLIQLCNEVFGNINLIDIITWFKKASPSNDAQFFSNDCEYILVYAKNKTIWKPKRLPLTEKQKNYYQNPDNDPRGPWNSATYTCNKSRSQRPNLYYPIQNPFTGEAVYPKETAVWAYSQEQCRDHVKNNMLYWGIEGKAQYPRFKKFLSAHQGVVTRTLWHYDDVNHTQGATMELSKLGLPYFPTPKPTALIQKMLRITTNKDSIILDFFSGSATTAHAVMQLNAEDSGHRKFIMVQLPEPCDEKSEAYKEGYHNICEIGKERIRLAGAEIKETDIGFRVLKLDSSNMKDIYYNPAQIQQHTLFESKDNIKEDRTPEDLLFQVMLDLGVLLSSKIEEKVIAGKKVFNVAEGFLIACFDSDITEETVKAVAQEKPYYAVFRDSSMANDSVATNFEQIFATYSPGTVRKVL